MRLIKVTSMNDGGDIYINVDHIGDFYEVKEEKDYNRIKTHKHTRIGVTTHNNGGFKVKETAKQILELIEDTIEVTTYRSQHI